MKTLCIACIGAVIMLWLPACNKGNDDNTPDDNWPSDSIRVLRSDLNFPWEILWGKDDHIWMTERGGKVSQLDPLTGKTLFSTTLSDVVSMGEGGLLGMVQHPDFQSNGYLYVAYGYNGSGGYREKVVRLRFQNNSLASPLVIVDNIAGASIHNGCRLAVMNNQLFISTGDASNSALAQDNSSINGKVLRVNLDGTIPADNPIPGSPVYSLGHRNIQGLVAVNNTIYASEHGANIEDELNIIEKGRNYGWPNVEGPCNGGETSFCTTNNVKGPIWSTGGVTLATSGLEYYNNDRIPQWKNGLLLATLKDATLYQFALTGNGTTVGTPAKYFKGTWGRLRDLCVSPAGRVYLCTSNGGNKDVLVEIAGLD